MPACSSRAKGAIAVAAGRAARAARPGGGIVVWPGERLTTVGRGCRGVAVPVPLATLTDRATAASSDAAAALRDQLLALLRQRGASDRLRAAPGAAVTAILAACRLAHPGRFAAVYPAHDDEMPWRTLAQRRGRW